MAMNSPDGSALQRGLARDARPKRALVTAAILATLFAVAAVTLVATQDRRQPPAPSAIGGSFSLTATDGSTVSDQTYAGKWELIYFGYTFCPDACPTALSDISLALEKLGPAAAQVKPLFITVDPKRDTRAALSDYLKSFDPSIAGLTGSEAETTATAAAYHVYVKPQSDGGGDYLVDHSAYIYVMDPHGKFVDVIDGATAGDAMAAKLQAMMNSYL